MAMRRGLRARRMGHTLAEFEQGLADNLYYERGTTAESASAQDTYWTLAVTIRDRLADRRARTAEANYATNPKFVYYLSAEYMLGRQLRQNAAVHRHRRPRPPGVASIRRLRRCPRGPRRGAGAGQRGPGRLAACLLDSLATLDIPAVGYGIRYEFGIFKQAFEHGYQVEHPDDWTFYGNPWEFPAPDDLQVVGFYGHTEPVDDDQGGLRARWVPGETVRGEPSHMLVPGYGTETVNIIRLWHARAARESFDLGLFNEGHYAEAVEAQMRSENLTKVLYPSDSTPAGQELRLKQQYFLVSCSLRDIIRRFRFRNSDWEAFPDKVAVQLNDTHPVLAIPELMRLLVDEYGVGWDQAWSITRRTFAYTCHTLLPEALETWPVPMFERLLPRHLEIIYAINQLLPRRRARPLPRRGGARRPDVAGPGGPRAPGADGQPGGRRQLRGQRGGRAAVAAAGPDDVARLRGAVAGEVPERDERRQSPPVPAAGQPAPVRPDHRPAGRRAVADRPGPAGRAGGLRRRSRSSGSSGAR